MMLPRFQAVPLDGFHIVLDLDEDRYLAVPRDPDPDPDPDAALGELCAHLSAEPCEIAFWPKGHPGATPAIADLGPRDPSSWEERPRPADWLALIPAARIARAELRRAPPRHWLRPEDKRQVSDQDAVIAAARRFRSMRPYLPGLTRCLPHALLLRAFLEQLGLVATLVIGVRVFPFDAHSWVEAGGIVLTDDVERLRGFTAIAAG